jgi:hypothetical protein
MQDANSNKESEHFLLVNESSYLNDKSIDLDKV